MTHIRHATYGSRQDRLSHHIIMHNCKTHPQELMNVLESPLHPVSTHWPLAGTCCSAPCCTSQRSLAATKGVQSYKAIIARHLCCTMGEVRWRALTTALAQVHHKRAQGLHCGRAFRATGYKTRQADARVLHCSWRNWCAPKPVLGAPNNGEA
jgi:hypothetical protein